MSKTKIAFLTILLFTVSIFSNKNVEANSYENYYATTTVNVRNADTNRVIKNFNKGDYLYGYRDGNWIYFDLNGKTVKLFADYAVQEDPIDMRVITDANVRNNNLHVIDYKEKGDVVYAVKIDNYYRFAENGISNFIYHTLLTDDDNPQVSGYSNGSVNIRSEYDDRVLGTTENGEWISGFLKNNYIHFIYNGYRAKVYRPLFESGNTKEYYITHDQTNVRDSKLNVVGTKKKGDKIQAIKIGDYYRYYENGIRFIHKSLLSDEYVAPTPKSDAPMIYSLSSFRWHGVVRWNGYKFTYYSQSVLPGNGLNIPGRHVNEEGYVADKDGYIVLASNPNISKGTVITTPFGSKGKVYDRCASCSLDWYDVYIK